MGVAETTIDTGGNTSDTETGGANVNMVPKDGGNIFKLYSAANYTGENLSSGDVPDDLVARGNSESSNAMRKVYDVGIGLGGPILRTVGRARLFTSAEGLVVLGAVAAWTLSLVHVLRGRTEIFVEVARRSGRDQCDGRHTLPACERRPNARAMSRSAFAMNAASQALSSMHASR